MKKSCCLLLLVCYSALKLPAQLKTSGDEIAYPVIDLRTGLTSWLDDDAGLMMGVNYRWSDHFSATIEPTWIFFSPYNSNRESSISPSGIKIRADIRYHFSRSGSSSPDFFIAPEFHYKSVNTDKEDVFGINCQAGQCAYFQEAVYTEKKKEIGGILKVGLETALRFIDKTERLGLEIYFGAGIKRLKFRETNLPIGGSFLNPPDRWLFTIGESNDRNTAIRPLLPFGLKLSFSLR